ncbi:short-chain dehydrogenase/reductase SDR [Parafrankia sp. EAN1pec]|uniref:SDR family NAD(P)-dependent oxidoreductase n=1 Tax=Parafrankia sp. (strain EAN1pec) TaxID=298653 RepID=UPI0000543216|nr:short-chain dehydrogenase/reductase SDR [Frankia sp. EAN1pec]
MTATGDLEGKVAIVTGAANGIGVAIATRFVTEGAKVVIADIDAGGQGVAAELGERATFFSTDVSDPVQTQALVDFTIRHFGGLHVLCNNAGVSGGLRRFLDDDLRDFERVVAVDLYGVMACSRSAARHMVDHGGGAIVNIASGAGITPGIGMLPYRAAKAGVVQFTRCLAVEVGEHGIRANCIAPANISTDINAAFDKATVIRLQPLPHQGRTGDIAEAALYLASDRAAHVTGLVLAVDGGMSLGTPPRR